MLRLKKYKYKCRYFRHYYITRCKYYDYDVGIIKAARMLLGTVCHDIAISRDVYSVLGAIGAWRAEMELLSSERHVILTRDLAIQLIRWKKSLFTRISQIDPTWRLFRPSCYVRHWYAQVSCMQHSSKQPWRKKTTSQAVARIADTVVLRHNRLGSN